MATPLPSKTQQRRRLYRPAADEVKYIYELINKFIFSDALSYPIINLKSTHYVWGQCLGWDEIDENTNSRCEIDLNPYWYCRQWFITALAHEMVHQFQWDIIGNINIELGAERDLDHGPSFLYFVPIMNQFNIPLKVVYDDSLWFKHQNLFLC
jgi:hypothetical protein